MDAYLPVFVAVAVIVGGIISLRVFFTLWTPIDRRISGDKLDVSKDIQISELKNKLVNVRFTSGSELRGVIVAGYCSTHHEAPYDFKQLLILRDEQGKSYYARIREIEYFEETAGSTSSLEPQ